MDCSFMISLLKKLSQTTFTDKVGKLIYGEEVNAFHVEDINSN